MFIPRSKINGHMWPAATLTPTDPLLGQDKFCCKAFYTGKHERAAVDSFQSGWRVEDAPSKTSTRPDDSLVLVGVHTYECLC